MGDVLAFNPPVFQRLLTGFLDRGETDERFFYLPMGFRISFGFPLPAKVFLTAARLAIVVLVFAVCQLMR